MTLDEARAKLRGAVAASRNRAAPRLRPAASISRSSSTVAHGCRPTPGRPTPGLQCRQK